MSESDWTIKTKWEPKTLTGTEEWLMKTLAHNHHEAQREYDNLKMQLDEEKKKNKGLKEQNKILRKEKRLLEERNRALNKFTRFEIMEVEHNEKN